MTRSSVLIWLARIAGVAFLSAAHLVLVIALVGASLSGSLARGPNGEELGHVYRESPEGQRNEVILDILEWPVAKPLSIVGAKISGATLQSAWRIVSAVGFYANSIAWGIGLWLLFEGILRGLIRIVRGPRIEAKA